MEGFDEKKARQIVDNMSAADKAEYRKMGYEVASKAVLSCLISALKEKRPLLADRIAKLSHNRSNAVSIAFMRNDLIDQDGKSVPEEYKLCSCLVEADSEYRTNLVIPKSFNKMDELKEQFTLLKLIAVTFWEDFKVNNSDVYAQITKVYGNIDLEEIVNNQTTLRFSNDELNNHRVSIFCYYTNEKNEILHKRC